MVYIPETLKMFSEIFDLRFFQVHVFFHIIFLLFPTFHFNVVSKEISYLYENINNSSGSPGE